ncbi:MAG: ParB/RepB/Spo0J family partition protein [Hyphomonadaceae bacterium]|jgi:ParB family chromosome partitioning protein|nr:ParB/RepB/Spo0J family partition protein [Hyphomonadaceae bacterium]
MVVPLQKGRLGRGLASLIGETPQAEARLPVHGEQRLLPIAELHPSGRNPRKTFDEAELVDLANSIRARGLVQPIIARPDPQRGGYEIVAGERRWRAAQRASLHNVTVIVRDLSDQEVAEFALIENVQRADLNAIEEAAGYQELIEKYNYTQEVLAEAIGKSRSHLANTLRLLKLPARIQALVKEGKLTPGHGRALVGREDAEKLAEQILALNLTVRDVEALVQNTDPAPAGRGGGTPQTPEPKGKDADTRAFEKDLSDALGLNVEVQRGSGESGYLSIKYSNFEQLDYIRSRLLGPFSH